MHFGAAQRLAVDKRQVSGVSEVHQVLGRSPPLVSASGHRMAPVTFTQVLKGVSATGLGADCDVNVNVNVNGTTRAVDTPTSAGRGGAGCVDVGRGASGWTSAGPHVCLAVAAGPLTASAAALSTGKNRRSA